MSAGITVAASYNNVCVVGGGWRRCVWWEVGGGGVWECVCGERVIMEVIVYTCM